MGKRGESELILNTCGSVVLTDQLLAGIHFRFVAFFWVQKTGTTCLCVLVIT